MTLVPTGTAIVTALFVLQAKASSPIWDDGVEVLAERYPITLATLLTPYHNQLHVLPYLLWAALPGAGLKLALLLGLHVVLIGLTTIFLSRSIGASKAAALTLPLAVFGAAAYDLVVPWQIVFVLPLALLLVATWASVARQRTAVRGFVVVAASVAAVLSSNVGMVGLMALGLWFLLERRWRQLAEIIPAGVLAIVWLLTWGVGSNDSPISHPQPFTTAFQNIPAYVANGFLSGIGAWFGLNDLAAIAGFLVVAGVLLLIAARRAHVSAPLFSFCVATLAMFLAISLIRSNADPGQAAQGRYAYLVTFYLAAGIGASQVRLPFSRWLLPVALLASALNARLLAAALETYP